MNGLFSMDSKLMSMLNKFGDLFILNIIFIISCIPIITIGASITAMHNVLLKIVRDEENYITKQFFSSFKKNFKQATLLWLIYLAVATLIGLDFYLVAFEFVDIPDIVMYLLYVVLMLYMFSFSWVFVLQSRYYNPIVTTIKNSFLISISSVVQTIPMLVINVLPAVLVFYQPVTVPIMLCVGFGVTGYFNAVFYTRIFDKIEGVERTKEKEVDDGWRVELEEETLSTQEQEEEIVQSEQ